MMLCKATVHMKECLTKLCDNLRYAVMKVHISYMQATPCVVYFYAFCISLRV